MLWGWKEAAGLDWVMAGVGVCTCWGAGKGYPRADVHLRGPDGSVAAVLCPTLLGAVQLPACPRWDPCSSLQLATRTTHNVSPLATATLPCCSPLPGARPLNAGCRGSLTCARAAELNADRRRSLVQAAAAFPIQRVP